MVTTSSSKVRRRQPVEADSSQLRNWFRPQYPYVYATFRCARDAR